MPTPREHIEKIRNEKFLIGSEKAHRILEEFHGTVELLSDELYSKDVHFFMELVQVSCISYSAFVSFSHF